MGVFDRFRRRNEEAALPEDVESYYREDRSSRRTAALLLGLATFVATLVIGSALYFGGRAVYRAISGDDSQEDVAQVEQNGQKPADEAENNKDSASEQAAGNNDRQEPSRNDSDDRSQRGGNATPVLGDQRLPATGDPGL
jgi:hypothetical protein